jgi:hypothetical protein
MILSCRPAPVRFVIGYWIFPCFTLTLQKPRMLQTQGGKGEAVVCYRETLNRRTEKPDLLFTGSQ